MHSGSFIALDLPYALPPYWGSTYAENLAHFSSYYIDLWLSYWWQNLPHIFTSMSACSGWNRSMGKCPGQHRFDAKRLRIPSGPLHLHSTCPEEDQQKRWKAMCAWYPWHPCRQLHKAKTIRKAWYIQSFKFADWEDWNNNSATSMWTMQAQAGLWWHETSTGL